MDVCIVGAGAAGIALAVELARCGRSVYLLDGGGAAFETAAQEPYQGTTSSLAHRGLHEGRFRAHGGTTTRWGGQILELDDADFEERRWIQDSGWPLRKSELDSFYQRAIGLEGLKGALTADIDVWRSIGMQPPHLSFMESYLSRWCPEPDFGRLHAAALQGPSIHVWLHANAVELLLQDEEAVGVRAQSQSGREAIFRARQYVFCLGGIESSRFFLQPRAGALPWNRSGLLGRHFQDHIDCNVGVLHPRSRNELHQAFDSIFLKGFKYQPKLRLSPERQQHAGVLNVAGTLAFNSDSTETMTALKLIGKQILKGQVRGIQPRDVLQMMRYAPAVMRQTYRYAIAHRSFQPANSTISLRVHCEQEPSSGSSITLCSARDSLGLFRTQLAWKISPLELKTIRYFADAAAQSMSHLGILVARKGLHNDDALTAACEDSFHHMGGMRMSSSPADGVVDTNLKLNGVLNTYVCSSAVFPTSGFSNPTHTVLALAVRLADHLLRQQYLPTAVSEVAACNR